MKITFKNNYKNRKGNVVSVYTITSASETELALYKSIQAGNYREDEESGKALYFTTNPHTPKVAELCFNQDNSRVYVRNEEELRMQALAKHHGVDLSQAMGQFIAQSMFNQAMGNSNAVAAATPAPAPVQAQQPVSAETEDGDDPFADEDGAPF